MADSVISCFVQWISSTLIFLNFFKFRCQYNSATLSFDCLVYCWGQTTDVFLSCVLGKKFDWWGKREIDSVTLVNRIWRSPKTYFCHHSSSIQSYKWKNRRSGCSQIKLFFSTFWHVLKAKTWTTIWPMHILKNTPSLNQNMIVSAWISNFVSYLTWWLFPLVFLWKICLFHWNSFFG